MKRAFYTILRPEKQADRILKHIKKHKKNNKQLNINSLNYEVTIMGKQRQVKKPKKKKK